MTTRTVQIKIDPSGAVSGAKVVKRSLDDIAKANISVERSTKKSRGELGRYSNSAVTASATGASLAATNRQVAQTMQRTAASTRTASNDLKAFMSIAAIMAAFKPSFSLLDSLAEVSTLVDTATFDMERIRSGAISMSREFGGSAASQTQAYYQIISAGASDAAGATTLLSVANKLAVGGLTSVQNATGGLTKILNTYGFAADKATDVSDAMFVAMKAGQTTIGELSAGIGDVAPLAEAMGIGIDELLASVSALSKGNGNTQKSFFGLRAMMAAIIKPSSEAAALANKLGLEFSTAGIKAKDLDGNVKGLTGFLKDLKEKTGGNTDAMAILFGGVEAIVPAFSLMGQAGLDLTKIMEMMADKADSTRKAVEKVANLSPSHQSGRMWSALQAEVIGLTLSLTQHLVPAMAWAADNMGSIVTVVGSLLALHVASKVATIALGFYELAKAAGAARVAMSFFGGPIGLAIGAVSAAVWLLSERQSIAAKHAQTFSENISTNTRALLDAADASRSYNVNVAAGIGLQVASARTALTEAEALWEVQLVRRNSFREMIGFKNIWHELALDETEGSITSLTNKLLKLVAQKKEVQTIIDSMSDDDKPNTTTKPRDISSILASVKNSSKTTSAYAAAVRSITEATSALQSETNVVGLSEFAKAKATKTQELLNAVSRDGTLVTHTLTGDISRLATEYANAASTLSVMEQAQENANARMAFAQDTTKGFISDLRSGLQAGENFWSSFANSAASAIDKITNRLLDQLLDAIFQVNKAGSGGGGMFGNLLANIFGGGASTSIIPSTSTVSTLLPAVYHNGGMIGGVNDNTRLMPASSFANATKMHNGNLRADERPIIAQTGELMLSRRDVAEARNAGANNNNGGGNVSNTYVSVKTDPSLEVKETRRRTSSGDYIDISVARSLNRGRATQGAMGSYGLSQRARQR